MINITPIAIATDLITVSGKINNNIPNNNITNVDAIDAQKILFVKSLIFTILST